jgi:hypothetical protein
MTTVFMRGPMRLSESCFGSFVDEHIDGGIKADPLA